MNESGIIRMLEMLGSNTSRLKRTGGNIVACCPLGGHEDKNPSFTIKINPSGPSSWHCYSCGEKANKTVSILYKVQQHGGGWRDDIHQLIKDDEYESPIYKASKLKDWGEQKLYNNNQIAGRKSYDTSGYFVQGYEAKFNEADYKEIMSQVPQYILDRGFTPKTCVRWKLGYHKLDYPQRLFIPIFSHEQQMVGWSGRLIHESDAARGHPKYKHVKHFAKEKYLYGEHLIDRTQKTCFIMESFMDVMNLDQLGVKNCLAIMGTSISAAQVDKVKRWFEKAIILPHDDQPQANGVRPGLKMADDCKYALEQVGIKVIISPIVPATRLIGGEIRNPQDPGEWTLEDVRWVFGIIRRIVSERESHKSVSSGQEKEETRREEKAAHGAIPEETGDPRGTGLWGAGGGYPRDQATGSSTDACE